MTFHILILGCDIITGYRGFAVARLRKSAQHTHGGCLPFYAKELALTPHYLSSLIAGISGKSVLYWINRATLVHAKVLLKNMDLLICDIADRLNFPGQSAFGLFFKRETGMTPSEYRKSD